MCLRERETDREEREWKRSVNTIENLEEGPLSVRTIFTERDSRKNLYEKERQTEKKENGSAL